MLRMPFTRVEIASTLRLENVNQIIKVESREIILSLLWCKFMESLFQSKSCSELSGIWLMGLIWLTMRHLKKFFHGKKSSKMLMFSERSEPGCIKLVWALSKLLMLCATSKLTIQIRDSIELNFTKLWMPKRSVSQLLKLTMLSNFWMRTEMVSLIFVNGWKLSSKMQPIHCNFWEKLFTQTVWLAMIFFSEWS